MKFIRPYNLSIKRLLHRPGIFNKNYHLTLSIKAKLNCMEIASIPRKKTSIASLFLVDILLTDSNT